MPSVYPFQAVQYRSGRGDVSGLAAPPYDVLDAAGKAALLARDPANIVGIDLPHVPANRLGPPEAYDAAASAYQNMLATGVLARRATPAMFAYRQSFSFGGKPFQRCGMACTVDTVPFGPRDGGGILPHEQTFGGPKEDRLALMRATGCQLSPVFGLFADDGGGAGAKRGAGARVVLDLMASRPCDMTADLRDGAAHEVWIVEDETTINAYRDALGGQDIFIADGHHRYNTALNYLGSLDARGVLPTEHPARRTMFVLVSMADPGLAIGPTHRVLGGMAGYSMERFIDAARGRLHIEPTGNDPRALETDIARAADREHANALGFYDYDTGRCFVGRPAAPDPLADRFADKPAAWRSLDVALVQHLVVEGICEPALNGGAPVRWAFPHTIDEVLALGRGDETGGSIDGSGRPQLGVVVRPTPLEAVRDISRAGELMPQKSTFFFPKLATGLFMHPLA